MLKKILALLMLAGAMNSAVGMGYLFEQLAERSSSDQPSDKPAGIYGETSSWIASQTYLNHANRMPLEWPSSKEEQTKLFEQTKDFNKRINEVAHLYKISPDSFKSVIKDLANRQINNKSEEEKAELQKRQAVLDKVLAKVEQRARL